MVTIGTSKLIIPWILKLKFLTFCSVHEDKRAVVPWVFAIVEKLQDDDGVMTQLNMGLYHKNQSY